MRSRSVESAQRVENLREWMRRQRDSWGRNGALDEYEAAEEDPARKLLRTSNASYVPSMLRLGRRR